MPTGDACGPEKFDDYRAFWLHYLREHAQAKTRAAHYAGTALVIAAAVMFGLTGDWPWLLAMPVGGYGFAWASHALVEGNRPATFSHPWWSLVSDFRMFLLAATGRLDRHLAAAGVVSREEG